MCEHSFFLICISLHLPYQVPNAAQPFAANCDKTHIQIPNGMFITSLLLFNYKFTLGSHLALLDLGYVFLRKGSRFRRVHLQIGSLHIL